MEKNLLKVKDISKTFPGTKALDQVNLEIKKGEIHALAGENGAGKSTLMNIIFGDLPPDKNGGKIFLEGNEISLDSPKEAQKVGIGFVHQELAVCEDVTVAENVFMDRFPKKRGGFIDYNSLYSQTMEILSLFNNEIKPDQLVSTLKVADQQIVEIAKALSLDCKLIIFDEPTSSLTKSEVKDLFKIINNLKEEGISVLFISHKMSEIFEICDRVTILKNGKYIDTLNVSQVTPNQVVNKMVGRKLNDMYPEKNRNISKKKLLEVKNFNRKNDFKNINFSLYEGEILGISGLVGAGRSEIARAICKIDSTDSGDVYLEEEKIDIDNYEQAIKNGLCYLTEDRKEEGLFLNLNLKENISAAKINKIEEHLLISNKQEKETASKFANDLNIVFSDLNQEVASLSGGNQQKVMLAKWLAVNPKVIFLDEPTRGIDVGAKSEIHNKLRELSNQGLGVIVISSELPEIIGLCDRVLIMYEGEITGELVEDEITEDKIIEYSSGKSE